MLPIALRSLRGQTACVFPELPGKADEEDGEAEEGVAPSADEDGDSSLAAIPTQSAKLLTPSLPQSTGEQTNPFRCKQTL